MQELRQIKDPRTFFFIASEGTETEVAYFDMINQYVKSPQKRYFNV
jgi:hypothetical protein